jgi:hypothetical protein
MEVFSRFYRLAHLTDLERTAALEPYGLQVGDVDVLAPCTVTARGCIHANCARR